MSAYPFDTTSALASNLIKNETHFAGESEYYGKWFIVPEFGPFYLNNFKITATTDGVVRELTIGVDYAFTFFYKAGSQSIGIPLFGGITLNKSSVNKNDIINITYQTLGGDWVADRIYVINQLLATSYNPILTVLDLLTDKLSPFPDIKSPYVINPEYGAQGLVVAIRNLAVAISKQETLADIIAHLSDFNNPHMDSKAMIGLPDMQNYPIALDSEVAALVPGEKYIVLSQLISAMMGISITLTAAPNLCGPKTVYDGSVNQYVITDFDSRLTYTVSVDQGTITQADDTLTYTAPNGAGVTTTLIVNGAQFPISVIPDTIQKPTIQNPASGKEIHSDTTLVTASNYQTLSGITTGHTATDWELATDAAFTNIVTQSLNDTADLTQWSVLGLVVDTTYYLRVRYYNAAGVSDWSDPVSFSYVKLTFNKFQTLLQTITPNDLIDLDLSSQANFGNSLAFSDDERLLVVGVPSKCVNSGGSVYAGVGEVCIYKLTNGVYQLIQTLASPYPNQQYQQFGCYLALSADGTTLLVKSAYLYLFNDTSEFIAKYGSSGFFNEIHIYKNNDLGNTDQFAKVSTYVHYSQTYQSEDVGGLFINADGSEFFNISSSYNVPVNPAAPNDTIYRYQGAYAQVALAPDGTPTVLDFKTAIDLGLATTPDQIGNFAQNAVMSKDFSTLVTCNYQVDTPHNYSTYYLLNSFKRVNNRYVSKATVGCNIDPFYTATLTDQVDATGQFMSINQNGTILLTNTYYPQSDPSAANPIQPYFSVLYVDSNGQFKYSGRVGPVAPDYPNTGNDYNSAVAIINYPGNTIAFCHTELLSSVVDSNYSAKVMIYESNFTSDQMADGVTVNADNLPVYSLVSTTDLGTIINSNTFGVAGAFGNNDQHLIISDNGVGFSNVSYAGSVYVLK